MGHSFEFARQNNWEVIEDFCKKVSGRDEIWYATNLQIKRYLSAVRSLVYTADETMVYNPTAGFRLGRNQRKSHRASPRAYIQAVTTGRSPSEMGCGFSLLLIGKQIFIECLLFLSYNFNTFVSCTHQFTAVKRTSFKLMRRKRMNESKKVYGLFTTIAMIVGICIGSGIFFKSDNILVATGGSVWLGVLVFVLSATSIIFGGLSMSELASRTDNPGGIIAYYEEFVSEKAACGMGWFQIFVYYPTIAVVVSWVVGIYTCILFGWPGTFWNQMLIGFLFYTIDFIVNAISARIGGGFQRFTMVCKMIPLIIIAIAGIFFGNPIQGLQSVSKSTLIGGSWLAAIGPVAFSFDGWIISTTIAPEIRNSKKNLPRALIISPLIILITYVAYFIGVTKLLDPQEIIKLQDAHVDVIAQQLFGGIGGQLILVAVILAVMVRQTALFSDIFACPTRWRCTAEKCSRWLTSWIKSMKNGRCRSAPRCSAMPSCFSGQSFTLLPFSSIFSRIRTFPKSPLS
jgi:hypothetical protein